MKNKLQRWFNKLRKIKDNRRILFLVFIGILLIDFLLHFLTYKFLLNDMTELAFILLTYVFSPLFDLLSIFTIVVMFFILDSLFKKSRLYAGLQWITITIILLMMNFMITELKVIFVTWQAPTIYFLYVLWESIIDPGISSVASYFTYDGDLMGAFEYFTSAYRLIPLLMYLLPFVRFVLSFWKPKAQSQTTVRVGKLVWPTFWTIIANMAVYLGCFGFTLFILILPSVKTAEGYQPYYELIFVFLAVMFVPFIVLGAFGVRFFKRKTTDKFRFNLNFVNGILNSLTLVIMLSFALLSFLSNKLGYTQYDPETFMQMGWIALVLSILLATNVFRILFQNKPLWKMEEEEEAARSAKQAIMEQTNNTEFRSPVGLVIPFTPDEPKGENNG